jgi:hypothetical protein
LVTAQAAVTNRLKNKSSSQVWLMSGNKHSDG